MSPLTPASVRKLFEPLAKPETAQSFFPTLAEDLKWDIAGPNATPDPFGHYESREDFAKRALVPVGEHVEGGGIGLVITHDPLVTGDWACVEFKAVGSDGEVARGKNGLHFDNRYAWLVKIVDDKVVEGRAYLDTRLVLALLDREIPNK